MDLGGRNRILMALGKQLPIPDGTADCNTLSAAGTRFEPMLTALPFHNATFLHRF
jgi:hypothetical protein